ncbi:MAG: hypothetical protein AB1413_06835 [Thermodesulfobacteriota bacterium]
MKQVTALLVMLFSGALLLSGCDQAKDLATEAAEKAKQDVVKEIGKAVNGESQGEQGDKTEKEEDEK